MKRQIYLREMPLWCESEVKMVIMAEAVAEKVVFTFSLDFQGTYCKGKTDIIVKKWLCLCSAVL